MGTVERRVPRRGYALSQAPVKGFVRSAAKRHEAGKRLTLVKADQLSA